MPTHEERMEERLTFVKTALSDMAIDIFDFTMLDLKYTTEKEFDRSSDFNEFLRDEALSKSLNCLKERVEEEMEELSQSKMTPDQLAEMRNKMEDHCCSAIENHFKKIYREHWEEDAEERTMFQHLALLRKKTEPQKTLAEKINRLKKMIDNKNRSTVPHQLVYPPTPNPKDVLIPTGGFAKCRCMPSCSYELPEPAHRVVEVDELKEQDSQKKNHGKCK